jgi:tetratricopeptide (TPR) repeat protein
MPNKKPKAKKKPSTPRTKRTAPATPPLAVDRRAMEKTTADLMRLLSTREFDSIDDANAFLQQALATGRPLTAPPRTPLEQAQDLMYDAWNATGRRRIQLARQALARSPDCADAYVLLAEEATTTPEEARDLYQQGVAAGERALGPELFVEGVGHFWGLVETRPYMRAREGLAHALWILGEREAAIGHLTAMLQLNPGDNQGVRYVLAQWLLETGADEELGQLLDQYPDDAAAAWAYTRALWRFRQQGATATATAALAEALSTNQFVPAYLLGRKRLPQRLPEYVGFGDDSEAIEYAAHGTEAWRMTPGALDWLASTLR